jgi:hypothetical protein
MDGKVEEAEGEVRDDVIFGTIGNNVLGLTLNTNASLDQTLLSRGSIPKTWILLDSQSTIDVFSNHELLCDIRPTKTTMHIKCNAGSKSTNL